jgi:hypothetical protein
MFQLFEKADAIVYLQSSDPFYFDSIKRWYVHSSHYCMVCEGHGYKNGCVYWNVLIILFWVYFVIFFVSHDIKIRFMLENITYYANMK